ncbi:Rossmann-fold NAD(P)-binding domain-containing protein [Jatrophihabitans fulvus]
MAGFSGRHALVTGAASGIGRAVAERLGRDGALLHVTDLSDDAVARTASSLRAGGATVVTAQAADVTDIDAVRRLAATVHASTPAVDAVLNVAGIAIWGTVDAMSHEQWHRVVDVNLMGPIHVIETFVPSMTGHRQRGQKRHLVNVSSAAGLIGLPWHAAYSASKFGLRGVSEVLRFDLARHGIAVTLACPGGVDTPLTDTLQVAGVDTSTPEFARLRATFRRRAVSPELAADRIVDGMYARRPLVFTSPDIRWLFALQRHSPRAYGLLMHAGNRLASRAARRLP